MLTLFVIFTSLLTILAGNIITYVLVLFIMYFYYLLNINMFFNRSLSVNLDFLVNDETSLFIRLLLFFVIFISYFSSINVSKSYKIISVVLLTLFFFCFEVFNTTHLFSLYFFYEASLVPILYIIIK